MMEILPTMALSILLLMKVDAFNSPKLSIRPRTTQQLSSTTTESTLQTTMTTKINKLKRVLENEYITFFDPMVTSWYAKDVAFNDPMTSLSGVDSYKNNVDMLAGRTLLGKWLFEGAGINLHSVTGGEVTESGAIGEIVTRWTLRVTAKVLPWTPEAVFSGVSIYKVLEGGVEGVQIVGQTDYWDSINIQENTDSLQPIEQYQKVSLTTAVSDFLGQLKPEGFVAVAAGVELPYVLLRRGDGYEIRRYPGFVGIQTPYNRRDMGFGSLGAFSQGMNPLAPSICTVYNDYDDAQPKDKMMMWPLNFAAPGSGSEAPEPLSAAVEKAGQGQWKTISLNPQSERIVTVRTFDDFATEQCVRNSDRELREMLKRDGLLPVDESEDFVQFCQHDAVHSMGKRRSEVWIELKDGGHPF